MGIVCLATAEFDAGLKNAYHGQRLTQIINLYISRITRLDLVVKKEGNVHDRGQKEDIP